jgi:hypothetical protein
VIATDATCDIYFVLAVASTERSKPNPFGAAVKKTDAPKGVRRASRKTFLKRHCAINDGKAGRSE